MQHAPVIPPLLHMHLGILEFTVTRITYDPATSGADIGTVWVQHQFEATVFHFQWLSEERNLAKYWNLPEN